MMIVATAIIIEIVAPTMAAEGPASARHSPSSPTQNGQRATMQTPQGFDATHGGELFPIDESRLTSGVSMRASTARLCCDTQRRVVSLVRQGVDALLSPRCCQLSFSATREKLGAEGTGVEILAAR